MTGERPGGFFTSWSGGKDSCLAHYRALQAGWQPKSLLNMLTEDGQRSRSHGLAVAVLRAQAAALGLPIVFRAATWEDYEARFLDALRELKSFGVEAGVFGDIDVEAHRQWVEGVCARAGMRPCEPLWKGGRRALLEEFIGLGFAAKIVVLRESALAPAFLGRTLDARLISEFEALGIDASGENGEYHTVVTNGPVFSRPLELEERGRFSRDGYAFLEMGLQEQR
jgi:uncharacterized protein (TIGR00290 family)